MNSHLLELILTHLEYSFPSSLAMTMLDVGYYGLGDSEFNLPEEKDFWATRFTYLLLVLAAEDELDNIEFITAVEV